MPGAAAVRAVKKREGQNNAKAMQIVTSAFGDAGSSSRDGDELERRGASRSQTTSLDGGSSGENKMAKLKRAATVAQFAAEISPRSNNPGGSASHITVASTQVTVSRPKAKVPYSQRGVPAAGFFKFKEPVKAAYDNKYAQGAIAGLIIANFISNLIEKEIDPAGTRYRAQFTVFEDFFNLVFLVELIANAYGNWWWPFICSGWNVSESTRARTHARTPPPFRIHRSPLSALSPRLASFFYLRAHPPVRLTLLCGSPSHVLPVPPPSPCLPWARAFSTPAQVFDCIVVGVGIISLSWFNIELPGMYPLSP